MEKENSRLRRSELSVCAKLTANKQVDNSDRERNNEKREKKKHGDGLQHEFE